jgi:hypothetical protein
MIPSPAQSDDPRTAVFAIWAQTQAIRPDHRPVLF